MRICFLTNELSSKNGWGRYSISLIEHLSSRDIDCCVLLSVNSQENDLSQVKNYRVLPPVFGNRLFKIFVLIKNYLAIRRIIKASDIVHVLVEPYSPIAYLANVKKPIIVTLHGTYAVCAFKKIYSKIIYSWVYHAMDRLICVSNFTKRELLNRINLSNTAVINNGVDYDKFQKFYSSGDKKTGKVIVGVGALMFRKGYHISVPAIVKVKEFYPDIRYYIVGNHKNKDYLKKIRGLVKENGLDDNIIFKEGLNDEELIKIYCQSDLFLLTPVNIANDKFEGLGLVYIEANACGKPVIGTMNCGAEDVITDGVNGFLVEQNSITQTSNAILKILNNSELAIELGNNGRKKAKSMDWGIIIDKYLQVYKTLNKITYL